MIASAMLVVEIGDAFGERGSGAGAILSDDLPEESN